jgi:hypothetical protein
MLVGQLIASTTDTRRPMHRRMKIAADITKIFLKAIPLCSMRLDANPSNPPFVTRAHRRWILHAVKVRTNHVHIVVSIGTKNPQLALGAFKANGTRQMKQDGCWQREHSPWVDKGSCRYLWNERSFDRAIDYVLNGQGDELPEFD